MSRNLEKQTENRDAACNVIDMTFTYVRVPYIMAAKSGGRAANCQASAAFDWLHTHAAPLFSHADVRIQIKIHQFRVLDVDSNGNDFESLRD